MHSNQTIYRKVSFSKKFGFAPFSIKFTTYGFLYEGRTGGGGGPCHGSRAEKLTNHGYLNFALKLFTCHAKYVCHGSRRIFFKITFHGVNEMI